MHAQGRKVEYIKNKETAEGENILLEVWTRDKGWRLEFSYNRFYFTRDKYSRNASTSWDLVVLHIMDIAKLLKEGNTNR